ncbi:hypothetical protein [Aneurinibacillus terranovensis]|uniref:hypothetical protein n=1 Tax=Aneurinibacillus terranovensis TaxID=278991 RepID=UPI0003FA8BAD|nr:hypothetical protein [Aneurinibacillus terranovensis]
MRRQQFNFQSSFLSEEAYKLIEHLSKTKQLSARIAKWAEAEVNNSASPDMKLILQEILGMKRILQNQSIVIQQDDERTSIIDGGDEPSITLISSNEVHTLIDEDDINYNY